MSSYDRTSWKEMRMVLQAGDDSPFGCTFLEAHFIPQAVLEIILSHVDPKDIPACNSVCRAWKDVIVRQSFWKKYLTNHGQDWSVIPRHLALHPSAWIIFFAQARHNVFMKNFIKPPKRGKLIKWPSSFQRREQARHGVQETDQYRGYYYRKARIDLWKAGLTPVVMQALLPFQIECKQPYCAWSSANSEFRWTVNLCTPDREVIKKHCEGFRMPSGTNDWGSTTCIFKMHGDSFSSLPKIRHILMIHEIKASHPVRAWLSNEMGRAAVQIRMLQEDEKDAGEDRNQNALEPPPEKPSPSSD